jgi:hypothetical protein
MGISWQQTLAMENDRYFRGSKEMYEKCKTQLLRTSSGGFRCLNICLMNKVTDNVQILEENESDGTVLVFGGLKKDP